MEAILLLRASADQSFTSDEISRKLYCEPKMLDQRLDQLVAAGLLQTVNERPLKYRYAPSTGDIVSLMDELAELYRTRRIAVTTLIYSDSTSALQSFSEAFRFRKDEK